MDFIRGSQYVRLVDYAHTKIKLLYKITQKMTTKLLSLRLPWLSLSRLVQTAKAYLKQLTSMSHYHFEKPKKSAHYLVWHACNTPPPYQLMLTPNLRPPLLVCLLF